MAAPQYRLVIPGHVMMVDYPPFKAMTEAQLLALPEQIEAGPRCGRLP